MEQIGTISCLMRYPVKSMVGETVLKADVTERGIAGDRTHAIFDVESGKVASAKRPSRWRALLKCTARTLAMPSGVPGKSALQLRFPDGSTITEHDAQVDEVLSNFLQRTVRLISSAPENAEIERSQPEEVLTHGNASDVASASELDRLSGHYRFGSGIIMAVWRNAESLPDANVRPTGC
jgi:uncharacterized protein YcbX